MTANGHEVSDVIIVGGGPSGIYSAFSCGMRGLKVKLIEARDQLGGRIPVYQENLIWDLAGAQGKLASEIASNLIVASQQFSPQLVFNQKVTTIKKETDGFSLTTDTGQVHQAKAVILGSALGIIRPRKLKVSDHEAYQNLRYLVSQVIDFKAYRDETVLLYGNPDSLSAYAKLLQTIAKSVIVVTKKTEVPNQSDFAANVRVITQTEITDFSSQANIISDVVLSSGETIAVSSVLIHLGMKREASHITFENFDLETVTQHGHDFLQNQADGRTSQSGLFVVGDLGSYPGKNYMLAACMSEAASAAGRVATYLDEAAPEQLIVSTHNDIFQASNQALLATYFD